MSKLAGLLSLTKALSALAIWLANEQDNFALD